MATRVLIRRGTTAEHDAFTGVAGEMTLDTDRNMLVAHDGAKAGGFPAALADGLPIFSTSVAVTAAVLLAQRGKRIIVTGDHDITLPDATAAEVSYTWVIHNTHSGAVTIDKGTADQTVKHLTGAEVTTITVATGTSITLAAGAVAELVCTAADNYIIFGAGIS